MAWCRIVISGLRIAPRSLRINRLVAAICRLAWRSVSQVHTNTSNKAVSQALSSPGGAGRSVASQSCRWSTVK